MRTGNRKDRAKALEQEIEGVKRELLGLGDLRPGTLTEEFTECGKPNCRCVGDPPRKHGPQYRLRGKAGERIRTTYVKKAHLATVRRQVRNYGRLRRLVKRWIFLSEKLCRHEVAAMDG